MKRLIILVAFILVPSLAGAGIAATVKKPDGKDSPNLSVEFSDQFCIDVPPYAARKVVVRGNDWTYGYMLFKDGGLSLDKREPEKAVFLSREGTYGYTIVLYNDRNIVEELEGQISMTKCK